MDWLDAIHALSTQATPAVLVTVAGVEGSGPRGPGARMLVTRVARFDTIGGGHLELRACELAHEMLALPATKRRLGRFPLGPSLGQCCGGVVHLAFERLDRQAYGVFECLHRQWQERRDSWRLVALDGGMPMVLIDAAGACLTGPAPAPVPDLLPAFEPERATHLMKDAEGRNWLVDPCLAYRPHLLLFGAGHVGAAIVRALGELPCHVTWVDERDDLFPAIVPANVKIEVSDTPEAVVDQAAAGSSFLVMTHSHALDLRLSEAILRRGGVGWFGLIGSNTKRRQFEHRLRARGIAQERLAGMVCPIGVAGITGKAPAVIAAAVCAQLLMVWEEAERIRCRHAFANHS